MTTKQLEIFVAVAEKENLTLAAESLFLAQPAVSHSLSLLEEELGVTLFVRSHQRLHLSEEGKRLLPYAQNALNSYASFKNEASHLAKKPVIRIASSLAFGERLLPETIASYDGKDAVEFHSVVAPSPEVFSLLEKGAVDFAFLETSVVPEGYLGKKAYSDRLALVSKNDAAFPSSMKKKDLASYSWLLRDSNSGTRLSFDNVLSIEGLRVSPTLESTSNASLLAFAEKGLGIAVIPVSLAKPSLSSKRIKEITIEGFAFPRSVYLVYGKAAHLSEQHQKFLAYLLKRFPLSEN
jgi:DNA-binding transcriptional LysR family regulator